MTIYEATDPCEALAHVASSSVAQVLAALCKRWLSFAGMALGISHPVLAFVLRCYTLTQKQEQKKGKQTLKRG